MTNYTDTPFYSIKTYPDGSKYIVINSYFNLAVYDLTWNMNDYEDVMLLLSLAEAANHNNIKINLTIPCLFQQQHDLRFNKNESHELKIICDLINSCKFNKVTIFHPHNKSVVMALINNVEIIDPIGQLEDTLIFLKDSGISNPIILSTDAGSFKWINSVMSSVLKCEKSSQIFTEPVEIYAASKVRSKEGKLVQVIKKDDFGGRDILVVDDLCVYGGTFINLADLLKTRNVGKLYLYVSHITVESPRKELEQCYKNIISPNTKNLKINLNNLITLGE